MSDGGVSRHHTVLMNHEKSRDESHELGDDRSHRSV
jgi:hypothetical protein